MRYVKGEDYDTWSSFLDCMCKAFPGIIHVEDLVIMSDREKGLAKAVSDKLPRAKPSHCCQHIAANI
jgi:hypothetical protein